MSRILAALLAACLLLSGCGGQYVPPAEESSPGKTEQPSGEAELPEAALPEAAPDAPPAAETPHEADPPWPEPPQAFVEVIPPIETDPIGELLSAMTLEEKVGQLFFPRCPAESAAEDVRTYHLGGYLLFGRDFKDKTAGEVIETIHRYQSAAAIPLLIGADEEGGTVVRISSNPHLRPSKFLSPQRLLSDGGMDAILAETAEKDRLLSALGVNVNLAPVADVSTDPADFIHDRTLGQAADATADYVAQVVAQMAADGMGSVLKHFPGYGSSADTHTGAAVDQRPLEAFETADLLPFISGMEAGGGTTAVLVSHNIVECIDAALPASLSPAVHTYLRETLGFDGVVMTDDLAMEAAEACAGEESLAVLALRAGNDLLITTDYRTQIPEVLEAVEAGALEEAVIDAACRRVLEWKQALGLLDA